jgi:8-oxo-dGTP diphosphatase
MKKYTVGFMFNQTRDSIILIEKKRPKWQKGFLNGVGGHIEKGETPLECMCREFQEEAGVMTMSWDRFAVITDNCDWKVHFFRKFVPQEIFDSCRTKTDEKITPVTFRYKNDPGIHFPGHVIRNINWLIPMALSDDPGIPFKIIEKGI